MPPTEIFSSSPESLGVERNSDSKSPSPMVSPTVLYKLLVPLLRCEVADMRDSVVLALGTINHVAIMDLMSEVSVGVSLLKGCRFLLWWLDGTDGSLRGGRCPFVLGNFLPFRPRL